MLGHRQGQVSVFHLALIAALAAALPASAATFPANAGSLGAIADGGGGTPPIYGASRDVTFTVGGLGGTLSTVSVDVTLTHTWVGDLDVVLKAPGGAPSLVVVSRIAVTTAGSFGDSSNYSGAYSFSDAAAGTNIWTVATTGCDDLCNVAAGSYRTTGAGAAGQTNPPPVTSLNATFAGLTAPQMNGTWTLTFRDGGAGDTGSVSAASLTLTSTITLARPVDFTGDGRSDFSIVRNTGGGPSGNITWWNGDAASTAFTTQIFGIATDFFTPGDFDGDGKIDIAIWRPGAAGAAGFWILPSSTLSAYFVPFGQTGDDPTVQGDYDGDGKCDLAVYRAGLAAGDQSTWYYKSSLTGAVVATSWGKNGDFPAPGDYDGDGKFDFAIQRNNGGGQAIFWIKQTTAGVVTYVFGTPTDLVVPGDYDGDGKTDLATVRGVGGALRWFYRRSSDGVIITQDFGLSSTDFPCQGDYDGDGRTDIAIWRPSATPGVTAFWVSKSSGGVLIRQWGQNGDYPVANFNSH
ncbi:MAG: proprotein convertase P-domain-containing protein [Thermoanaerobaculia bacterium]|nr:proprotein convertase P-domain-containing protein [Thermoanaerobaculia bacterium]